MRLNSRRTRHHKGQRSGICLKKHLKILFQKSKKDFILDDETWEIRYLIVDTRNWWPVKKVLVSAKWVEQINWSARKIVFNVSRETIQQAPEYSEGAPVTRDYEAKLHGHYNRQGYWVDPAAALTPFVLG